MVYFYGLFFTLVTGIVVIAGDVILKMAAAREGTATLPLIAAGCVFYSIGAILWFWAMRHTTLAQASVAYSMFTLLALALIGAFWFKEDIGGREGAGIGFAPASMVMMARFQ